MFFYALWEIIVIGICAILARTNNFVEVAQGVSGKNRTGAANTTPHAQ